MDKTHRNWLVGSISAAGIAALLSGCGTPASNTTPNTNPSANTAASASVKKASYPLTLKDSNGHSVTIPKKPVRIASTTEGTDEILSALVPKKDVVLVTADASQPAYSNVVQWAKGIPAIQQANAEQIIAVHPDLVLAASYTTAGVVSQIEQAKIPVFEFTGFNSVSNIEQNIELVGKLIGEQVKADTVVTNMNKQIHAIQGAVKGQQKVTVLDYGSDGYAAGKDTTVNDIIVDAGGINAASQLTGWKEITPEEVIKMNPQVIIDANSDGNFVNSIMKNPEFQNVAAVKNHRVYAVNGADLSSVSQYIVKGISDVAHLLYPSVKLPH